MSNLTYFVPVAEHPEEGHTFNTLKEAKQFAENYDKARNAVAEDGQAVKGASLTPIWEIDHNELLPSAKFVRLSWVKDLTWKKVALPDLSSNI